MNKLKKLFEEKPKDILSVYFTAGFPKLQDTARIIRQLEKNGVDLIEVGIPFSDPLADGPTIQQSSKTALQNGMSISVLFEQLKSIDTKVPLVLMGYLNPVLQYGVEKFCSEASARGIAGLIIPDLPLQEYLDEYKDVFEKYDLKNIFLVSPQTSETRIRLIDEHSGGFIYMVASASTTGSEKGITNEQENYFQRVLDMQLKNPVIAGFGISDHRSYAKVCEYANGAITGSAFIRAIENSVDLEKDIEKFIGFIRQEKLVS